MGLEVHLKAWHLLLLVFKEAAFSNPHLNTTEEPVCFFFPWFPMLCTLSLGNCQSLSQEVVILLQETKINQSIRDLAESEEKIRTLKADYKHNPLN